MSGKEWVVNEKGIHMKKKKGTVEVDTHQSELIISLTQLLGSKPDKAIRGVGCFFYILELYGNRELFQKIIREIPGSDFIRTQYQFYQKKFPQHFQQTKSRLITGRFRAFNHLILQMVRDGFTHSEIRRMLTAIIRYLQEKGMANVSSSIEESIPGFNNLLEKIRMEKIQR